MAATAAKGTRAIPIRRPDQPSAPSSPKPQQQQQQQPPQSSQSGSDDAMSARFNALNVASAPVFVPKFASTGPQEPSRAPSVSATSTAFNPNSRPFTPPVLGQPAPSTSQLQPTAPDFQFSSLNVTSTDKPQPVASRPTTTQPASPLAPEFLPAAFQPQHTYDDGLMQTPASASHPEAFNPYAEPSQDGSANSAFYGHGVGRADAYMPRMPLYYHLYQQPLPHIASHDSQQLALNSFFISPTLREDLQKRAEALAPVDGLEIPGYFSLVALDTPTQTSNAAASTSHHESAQQSGLGIFGIRNWVYKAVAESDGKPYIVRRLENFRLPNDQALSVIEHWRRIRHPNIVHVREAFTTRAFGDASVVFVYDIHPLAKTLYDQHLSPTALSAALRQGRPGNSSQHVPERVLWSYIIQLANAIKHVHAKNLAVRTIELSKILVTGHHRVRINGCGMLDVIRNDLGTEQALHQLQQDDLIDLGKVILALACNSPSAVRNLRQSLDYLARTYSPDVQKLLLHLFTKPSPSKSIDQVFALAGSRLLDEYNASLSQSDILESEMMREIENGRLVRLLTKFGFINERPEFDHDPRWAESGDRYLIKLFRDYVFHQVDEHGRPVLDLSHVLTCLNKLDAGVDDKVMLVSRDSQSCLVVSYREIKNCIEAAYRDLNR